MREEALETLKLTLKACNSRNTLYYVVMTGFLTENYRILDKALLLPVDMNIDNEDILYFSIMYKVEPTDENLKEAEQFGEGLVKVKIDNLIALLLSGKVVAYNTESLKPDEYIDMLLKEL